MARSYNSSGAGETPKLEGANCGCVSDTLAQPGSDGGSAYKNVTVSTDLPKSGPGRMTVKSPGEPSVARPGGAQSASKS